MTISSCYFLICSFIPKVSTSSVGTFPKRVKIVEVGPRDGLQNEKVKMEINQNIVFSGVES